MAYVRKRGKRFSIGYRDAAGRWREFASTATTKGAAQRLADDLEAKAERQKHGLEPMPDPNGGGRWADLVNWYGETYAASSPNFRRWKSFRDVHLLGEAFKSKRVADVTPEFLEEWIQEKVRDDYAPQTTNNFRVGVSVIFTKAKKAGRWHGANPALTVDRRKVTRRVRDFLRPNEVAPVFGAATARYGPNVTAAFALGLYAGLRKGEVAGLQKPDVNLREMTLIVRRSHARDEVKGKVEVMLPIHPELAPFLAEAIEASPSAFVCPGDLETGRQMPEHFDLEGRLRRSMADARVGVTGFVHHCQAWHCEARFETEAEEPRACPKHGRAHMLTTPQVRPLSFHGLRRSHASLLAAVGVSITAAQRLMRHSDPKLTEAVYTVMETETLRREVGRMSFLPRTPALPPGDPEVKP
jgi:integrase